MSSKKKAKEPAMRHLTNVSGAVDDKYDEALKAARVSNPMIDLPTKHTGSNLFFKLLAFLLNTIIPTHYARYRMGRRLFTLRLMVLAKLGVDTSRLTPRIPRPTVKMRTEAAIKLLNDQMFHNPVTITQYHKGGGVGKTTTSILLSRLIKSVVPGLVVTTTDMDNGTASERILRNNPNSVHDLVKNLSSIHSLQDLLRYCSRTREGVHVIAGLREDQLKDEIVSPTNAMNVMDVVAKYSTFSFIDMAAKDSNQTTAIMSKTDHLVIPTFASGERLRQAKETFLILIDEGFLELAQTCTVFVVANTRKEVEAVRNGFLHEFPNYTPNVQFVRLPRTKKLDSSILGSDVEVSPSKLTKVEKAELLEAVAVMTGRLTQTSFSNPVTQTTHRAEASLKRLQASESADSVPVLPTTPEMPPREVRIAAAKAGRS